MTDGPFKNAELSSAWKRYGEDLVSDAKSPKERVVQACHSLLGDIDMGAFYPLLGALNLEVRGVQMELDPIIAIEAIFGSRPKSLLSDILQKHMIANLRGEMRPDAALNQALDSTVRDLISTAKNSLDEECIRARDLGDMSRANYRKGLERNREAFASISVGEFRDALTSGKKHAFKDALQKKVGVDEGPEE